MYLFSKSFDFVIKWKEIYQLNAQQLQKGTRDISTLDITESPKEESALFVVEMLERLEIQSSEEEEVFGKED